MFYAIQVDLGLLACGALRLDTRFERLDLQGKLGVHHEGNAVPRGYLVALAHGERHDGAADARARNQLPDWFHRRDDGLPVVDLLPGDGLLGGGGREEACHQKRGGGSRADHVAFLVGGPPCGGLDIYISKI